MAAPSAPPRPSPRFFSSIDVYELPHEFVLVGHAGKRRHLLHVSRAQPPPATAADDVLLPPVIEDASSYTEAACAAKLHALAGSPTATGAAAAGYAPARILRACALLGVVRFLEGWHMLFVTRSEVVGVIGGHAIHRIEETVMLSVASKSDEAGSGSGGGSGAGSGGTERSCGGVGTGGGVGGGGGGASGSSSSSSSLVKGSKRLMHAAVSGLATRLQLTGWAENWAESKCVVYSQHSQAEHSNQAPHCNALTPPSHHPHHSPSLSLHPHTHHTLQQVQGPLHLHGPHTRLLLLVHIRSHQHTTGTSTQPSSHSHAATQPHSHAATATATATQPQPSHSHSHSQATATATATDTPLPSRQHATDEHDPRRHSHRRRSRHSHHSHRSSRSGGGGGGRWRRGYRHSRH